MGRAMAAVTLLRLPRRASPFKCVTLALTLPVLATLAVPGGSAPPFGFGVATVALIGVLAWSAARAVSEPQERIGIALATSLAVALLAPVAVSLLVPALLGIAWLRRPRPPTPANDNPVMERSAEFSWVLAARSRDIEAVQTIG